MREWSGIFEYVPYYCEENIWRLLPTIENRNIRVILAFGKAGSFAMLRQRAGRPGDGLVFWDYHVFALRANTDGGGTILDFDTDLGFETDAEAYLECSFGGVEGAENFAPLFRVVDGREYLRRFYSDRSHMKSEDGSWLAAPPTWPHPGIGLAVEDRWSLADLIDPNKTEPPRLLDLLSLRNYVGTIGSNHLVT